MRILVIFILVFTILSCTQSDHSNKPMFPKISGKVINGNKGDTLYIIDEKQEEKNFVLLDDSACFSYEWKKFNKNYYLKFKESYSIIPVYESFDLKLEFHADSISRTAKFSGKGSEEITVFKALSNIENDAFDKTYYGYQHRYSEAEFLHILDSIYDEKLKTINGSTGLNSNFYNRNIKASFFRYLFEIAHFESNVKQFGKDPNFKVSSKYPYILDSIDIYDSLSIDIPCFPELVEESVFKAIDRTKNWDKESFELAYYDALYSLNLPRSIESYFLDSRIPISFKYEKFSLDSLVKKLKIFGNDSIRISLIDSLYNRSITIQPGSNCPDFVFLDESEKEYNLKSFTGKYVVFDLWATWCLPCIKEFAFLDSLKKEFASKNIKFVSVCCSVHESDTKENWLSSLKKHQLTGIQLFSEGHGKTHFFKKLAIEGLPHFLIIDPNGKIVNARAKKPSFGKMRGEIKSLFASK